MDEFDSLRDQVNKQFRRASNNVSYRTKQYANWRLTQLRPQLAEVSRKNAYESFLIDQIQAEKERFQLYREYRREGTDEKEGFLEGTYYDDFRESPVCTCDGKHAHKCPLKRGSLPREVRTADDIDAGIRAFRDVHDGRPIVLLDAQEEWAEKLADVERELRDLIAILSTDTIPDDAEWPAASGADEQVAD